MSIICKLFGHDNQRYEVSGLHRSENGDARVTIKCICMRCENVTMSGVAVEDEAFGKLRQALGNSTNLLRSNLFIANRYGRNTRWTRMADKLVDQIMDNSSALGVQVNLDYRNESSFYDRTPYTKPKGP